MIKTSNITNLDKFQKKHEGLIIAKVIAKNYCWRTSTFFFCQRRSIALSASPWKEVKQIWGTVQKTNDIERLNRWQILVCGQVQERKILDIYKVYTLLLHHIKQEILYMHEEKVYFDLCQQRNSSDVDEIWHAQFFKRQLWRTLLFLFIISTLQQHICSTISYNEIGIQLDMSIIRQPTAIKPHLILQWCNYSVHNL